METEGIKNYLAIPEQPSSQTSLYMLEVFFRQKRLILITFATVLAAAIVALILIPSSYEAEMQILVTRDRSEPVVGSDATPPRVVNGTTEEEVNSEVDLLKSRDLLQQVVLKSGLADRQPNWFGSLILRLRGATDRPSRIAYEVDNLDDKLDAEPPKKSNLISVTYSNRDPETAALVLNTLADLYVQKHLTVHRPSGTFDFYQQAANQYRANLQAAQAKLVEFSREHNIVSAEQEKESILQRLAAAEGQGKETQASIREAEYLIRELEREQQKAPVRTMTQVRTSTGLVQQLKSTLFNLQLKRTELLQKFAPTYRPVQDINEQIASTQKALAEAESSPIREETTDNDPTHSWATTELAKARSQHSALAGKNRAIDQSIRNYREKALKLDQVSVQQQDLIRAVKIAETNYMLYTGKKEEARIADELDKKQIVNVAIAERATTPGLPTGSALLHVLLATLFAMIMSTVVAFGSDYLDPSLRSPREVRTLLQVPVIAVIPADNSLEYK